MSAKIEYYIKQANHYRDLANEANKRKDSAEAERCFIESHNYSDAAAKEAANA